MQGASESTERPDTADPLIAEAAAALHAAGVPTARLDAEVLLAAACGLERTALYARGREPVPLACRATFHSMVARRVGREPLQYIVGRQEFWSLDFAVTPDVLIPRPETELLVEAAVALAAEFRPEWGGRARVAGAGELTICDLGTGSGCIAVALARELPHAQIVAADVSRSALAVAQANARRHGVDDRVRFVASDMFAGLGRRRFDAIVCNPPYVRSDELQRLQPELSWEPQRALDGGADGLDVIRRVLAAAPDHLVTRGWLLMEISAEQGTAVEALARAAGFSRAFTRCDYAGLPRLLVAQR
jgi:release factor glutamine methyltransferase